MLVDIISDSSRPFLLVLHKDIVEVVKLRKSFVERHKLLVAHVSLYHLMVKTVEGMALVNQPVEILQPPVAKSLVSGIFPNEVPVSVWIS